MPYRTRSNKGKVHSNCRHSSWQTLSGRHRTCQSQRSPRTKSTNRPTNLSTVRVRERKVISISMYPFGVLWSLMGHRGTIQLLPWDCAEISNTEIYNVYKYEHTFSVPYPIHTGTRWRQLCRLTFPSAIPPYFLQQNHSPTVQSLSWLLLLNPVHVGFGWTELIKLEYNVAHSQ